MKNAVHRVCGVCIGFVIIALLCQPALAGDQGGNIIDLRVSSSTLSGPTHVMINGAWNYRPACATLGYWAINTDTAAGKSMLSALLTAYAMGKTVYIWGNGNCDIRGDMETIVQVGITQ